MMVVMKREKQKPWEELERRFEIRSLKGMLNVAILFSSSGWKINIAFGVRHFNVLANKAGPVNEFYRDD
jgi:hypothetical protein